MFLKNRCYDFMWQTYSEDCEENKMTETYFKYKALSLGNEQKIDERTSEQVIGPIADSYFYLPTRQRLNDPNEGIFRSRIKNEVSLFLRGITAIGERNELTQSLFQFESALSLSADNSGVFSLSHTASDELMWAHYCASHCGIAIEYNLNQLTRFSASENLHCFKVNYSSQPPDLSLREIQHNPREAIKIMLGYKSPKWSYEEEFRVLLDNINGKVPHDYRAVKSITFGLKVPEPARNQIYEATKRKVPSYFEIQQIKDTYQLQRVPIPAYSGTSPVGKGCSIDWDAQFGSIDSAIKRELCEWAKSEIESDPHFSEFWQAERSSSDLSKAVLQYESSHQMGLDPRVTNTRIYREI